MFDIGDRTTFEHLDYWKNLVFEAPNSHNHRVGDVNHVNHVNQKQQLPLLCILGCKGDKDTRDISITSKEIEEKAAQWNNCPWWIISTRKSIPLVGSQSCECEYLARENPVSGEMTLHVPNRLNLVEKLRKYTPREQLYTVFSQMALLFDRYIQDFIQIHGRSNVCNETCSLGTFVETSNPPFHLNDVSVKNNKPLHLVDIPFSDDIEESVYIMDSKNTKNKCCN